MKINRNSYLSNLSKYVVVFVCLVFLFGVLEVNFAKNRPKKRGVSTKKMENNNVAKKLTAMLETNKGVITFELLTQDAPKTCENFHLLADRGYYNNVTFHRIIKGFMIQGGDPKGNGTGGQSAFGKEFEDEINPSSPLYKEGYLPGIVAMANRGPNTNGSQFFIMHKQYPLPPKYTIFGRVISGQDVVDAIALTPTNSADHPLSPVVIKKAKVEVVK